MKTKRNGKRSVLVQPALEVSLLSVPSLFSSLSNANTFPFTFRECSIADRWEVLFPGAAHASITSNRWFVIMTSWRRTTAGKQLALSYRNNHKEEIWSICVVIVPVRWSVLWEEARGREGRHEERRPEGWEWWCPRRTLCLWEKKNGITYIMGIIEVLFTIISLFSLLLYLLPILTHTLSSSTTLLLLLQLSILSLTWGLRGSVVSQCADTRTSQRQQ